MPKAKQAPKATPVGGKGVIGDTDAAINAIYNQLTGQLSSGVGVQGMNFDRARQLVGSSFDSSNQLMRDGASSTVGGLNGQFDRLGIGAATDSATQGIRNQFQQGLVSAARRRQNELATMGQQQVGYEQAGRMGVDNAFQQQAMARTQSQTQIQEALANMEAARAQAQGQVDLARVQGQSELERMKMEFAQAAQEAEESGDPLLDLKAQSLGMDIMLKEKKLAEEDDGGDERRPTKYQAGLDNYLLDIGASPQFKSRVQKMYADATANAQNPLNIASGRKDPYAFAMESVDDYNMGANKDRLRQALQILFGKV